MLPAASGRVLICSHPRPHHGAGASDSCLVTALLVRLCRLKLCFPGLPIFSFQLCPKHLSCLMSAIRFFHRRGTLSYFLCMPLTVKCFWCFNTMSLSLLVGYRQLELLNARLAHLNLCNKVFSVPVGRKRDLVMLHLCVLWANRSMFSFNLPLLPLRGKMR